MSVSLSVSLSLSRSLSLSLSRLVSLSVSLSLSLSLSPFVCVYVCLCLCLLLCRQLEPFFSTACKLLKSSDSEAQLLLCHIPRAEVTQEVMLKVAQEHELTYEQLEIDLSQLGEGCSEYDSSRACLYRFFHAGNK